MILSVRYRNHFPVVKFQNQTYIWNPHGTGHESETIWGAMGAPNIFLFLAAEGGGSRRLFRGTPGAPNMGHTWRPNFFFLSQMGVGGAKGGAEGATPPNGEGNHAEGWYFASF